MKFLEDENVEGQISSSRIISSYLHEDPQQKQYQNNTVDEIINIIDNLIARNKRLQEQAELLLEIQINPLAIS